jgi:hypothetical protein
MRRLERPPTIQECPSPVRAEYEVPRGEVAMCGAKCLRPAPPGRSEEPSEGVGDVFRQMPRSDPWFPGNGFQHDDTILVGHQARRLDRGGNEPAVGLEVLPLATKTCPPGLILGQLHREREVPLSAHAESYYRPGWLVLATAREPRSGRVSEQTERHRFRGGSELGRSLKTPRPANSFPISHPPRPL